MLNRTNHINISPPPQHHHHHVLPTDHASYMLDPTSRYPTVNLRAVLPFQVRNLFDTDNPAHLEEVTNPSLANTDDLPKKRKRRGEDVCVILKIRVWGLNVCCKMLNVLFLTCVFCVTSCKGWRKGRSKDVCCLCAEEEQFMKLCVFGMFLSIILHSARGGEMIEFVNVMSRHSR